MNTELVFKWIEALEGDNYKQGQHRLRDADNNFCCLGVVCDLADPDKWRCLDSSPTWNMLSSHISDKLCNELNITLWGGKINDKPFVIGDEKYTSLVTANDAGESFLDIAQALREYYELTLDSIKS